MVLLNNVSGTVTAKITKKGCWKVSIGLKVRAEVPQLLIPLELICSRHKPSL